jgi:predicted Ser/Thr protein kinase
MTYIPTLIDDKFRINVNEQLGKGSFGYVFAAYDKEDKKYAAKFELKSEYSLLHYEYTILMNFQDKIGFPKIHFFTEQEGYYVLILELLGMYIYIV